jgi:hypothetical protein
MFATTKRFWSTMQLITNKYVLYTRLFIFALGGGGLLQFYVPSWLEKNEF